MPDIKRTRKGRPGPKAQRSALIVASGKHSGRDAQVQPKREKAPRPDKPSMLSVFEAGDSVEAFLERANEKEEAFANSRGDFSRAVYFDPDNEVVDDPDADADGAAAGAPRVVVLAKRSETSVAIEDGALFTPLDVPRRPPWDATTSAAELDANEKNAFVDWRRDVAALEEGERKRREAARAGKRLAPSASVSTPFERNLEVWRQLWRTLERSDAILLLVDARWPDFYANPDLVAYAKSLGRGVQVVVNKADYLRAPQRRAWAAYFEAAMGLETVFFSARREQAALDADGRRARDGVATSEAATDDEMDDDEAPLVDGRGDDDDDDASSEYRLVDRHELLARGEALARRSRSARGAAASDREGRPLCVGMVGYPNVGKSSCVNVLRNCSAYAHGVGARAGVSATPGKTKHLQTLFVREDFELCDCPGLVFPALVRYGSAELICSGVVPVARMREPLAACQLVADRTPRALFDALYGTALATKAQRDAAVLGRAPPLDARDLLDAVCERQDYLCSGSGAFDHNRAGRELVKAYVDGVLLHCHAPPGASDADRRAFDEDTRATALRRSGALRAKLDDVARRARAGRAHHADVLHHISKAGFRVDGVNADGPDAPPPPPAADAPATKPRAKIVSKRNNKFGKKGRKFRGTDPYAAPAKEDEFDF